MKKVILFLVLFHGNTCLSQGYKAPNYQQTFTPYVPQYDVAAYSGVINQRQQLYDQNVAYFKKFISDLSDQISFLVKYNIAGGEEIKNSFVQYLNRLNSQNIDYSNKTICDKIDDDLYEFNTQCGKLINSIKTD